MANGMLNAFGLDIGDESVKIVQLEKRYNFKKEARVFLRSYGSAKIPKGIITGGAIKDFDKLGEIISNLIKNIKGKKIDSKTVIASLPETKTFLKIVEIKIKNGNGVENFITKAAESVFPVQAEEVYIDWQALGKKHDNDLDLNVYMVIIGAALKKTVDDFTYLLESINLIPLALEIEGIAIARAVTHSLSDIDTNQAILDIGATYSNLIILQKNNPVLSVGVPVSGNNISKTISHSLKISEVEAEIMKIKCGLDLRLCEGKLRPILLDTIDDITSKINDALDFKKQNSARNKIKTIYLTGGGSNLLRLDSVLSQKLKMKIRKCDLCANIITNNKDFIKEKNAAYATAIGLALKPVLNPPA